MCCTPPRSAGGTQQGLLGQARIIREHMPLQAGTRLGSYEVIT
jgi:hypothetical protein